jgi:hypothetical protein
MVGAAVFVGSPDAEHPIRWEPIGSGDVAWLSLEDAVDRLTRSGGDPAATRRRLLAGSRERTLFAYYELDAHVEAELRALHGDR